MTFLMLFAGLALLLISGEFLVRGSVSLAGHFKISTLVVGLTVVSFGTSAPELVVSLNAAVSGHADISVGNVVGSNISNIGLVLALTIIIAPFFVNTRALVNDWLIMMSVTLVLVVMLLDLEMSRLEGLILVSLLLSFIAFSIWKSRRESRRGTKNYPPVKFSLPVSIIIIIVSCLGLVGGADMLVKGASEIARMMGVSERIISVSIIALGTSLPELATSAVAAVRKQNDISIGNILGSNIFNILAILGITATFVPFEVKDPGFTLDMIWMTGISLMLFAVILPLRGAFLNRWRGLTLAAIYFLYIYFVFFVK